MAESSFEPDTAVQRDLVWHEDGRPFLRAGMGHPPNGYDLVLTSMTDGGGTGALTSYIVGKLGIIGQTPDWGAVEDPFLLPDALKLTDGPTLQPVVTIGFDRSTEVNLEANLYMTLYNYFRGDGPRGAPRSIWIPLLGTGAGGLSFLDSANIVSEVLTRLHQDLPDDYAQLPLSEIMVTGPANMDDKEFEQVVDVIRRTDISPPSDPQVQSSPDQAAGFEPGEIAPSEKPVNDPVLSDEPGDAKPDDQTRSVEGDDLKQIKGIGPKLEATLKDLGITKYEQIASWTADDVAVVEEKVKLKGRVARDDWIAQASVLRGQNPYDPDEEVAHRPPPADQRAFFKPDRPADRAKEDRLNRVAMAEAIAENVFTVWKEAKEAAANKEADGVPLGENEIGYPGHPFIVHIAGRWGSGKSSILNFLREILERRTDETLDPPAGQTTTGYTKKNWVVIEFNAWRQQATGPAWWALMTAVRSGIGDQIGPRGDHFAWRDWFWRLRST